MNAVTIVLPVHNVERTLRQDVLRILELTEIGPRRMQLAVVDDGSTDGTYECACELARQFPQVLVMRQPYQSGLRPALSAVKLRLGVDDVIAYNGVGPIRLDELAALLKAPVGTRLPPARKASDNPYAVGRGSRRFGAVTQLNARMAEAHGSIGAFRWLRLDDAIAPRRMQPPPPAAPAPTPSRPVALGAGQATMPYSPTR